MKRGPVEASAIHHQPVSGEMTFPRFMKRGPVEALVPIIGQEFERWDFRAS